MNTKTKTIDSYIKRFPKDIQKLLKQMRKTIQKAAPKAEEAMKYGMPAFTMGKNLVFFAAYKKHIGFYPTPKPIAKFKKDLVKYKTSKGAIQFSLEKPLPLALITRMVKFRVKQISAKA